jgi:hypothetical protein
LWRKDVNPLGSSVGADFQTITDLSNLSMGKYVMSTQIS